MLIVPNLDINLIMIIEPDLIMNMDGGDKKYNIDRKMQIEFMFRVVDRSVLLL